MDVAKHSYDKQEMCKKVIDEEENRTTGQMRIEVNDRQEETGELLEYLFDVNTFPPGPLAPGCQA